MQRPRLVAADWLLRWDRYSGEVEPAHLEAIAAGLTAMGWSGGGGGGSLPAGVGMDVSMTYAQAIALGARPALPAGARLRIYGGSSADPSPGWMIAGDYRQYGSGGGGTAPDTFTNLFEKASAGRRRLSSSRRREEVDRAGERDCRRHQETHPELIRRNPR